MNSRVRGRRAAFAAAGAVLALAVALIPGGARNGASADPGATDPVRVQVAALQPAILTDQQTLIVAGRVGNASLTPVTDPVVSVRLASMPVSTRGQLRQPEAGEFDSSLVTVGQTYLGPTLPVGASQDFRIVVPVRNLPLAPPGVYVLAVEVVGGTEAGYNRVGISRTLLPYVPAGSEPETTSVVLLWPLAAAPARDARGILLSTALPDEISDGGRLRGILDAGRSAPDAVSWIVDSELLQTVSDMQSGYLVDDDGTVLPGSKSAAARAWLDDLRRATDGREVRTLPYADVEADGLVAAGMERDLVRSLSGAPALAATVLGRTTDGSVAWAAGGRFTTATIEALAAAGARTLIMRDSAMPAIGSTLTPSGSTDIATASGTVRALLTDSGLSEALVLPQRGQAQILSARQRFLAELTVVALEAPTIPRTLVAAPLSTRWRPSAALLRSLLAVIDTTPWLATKQVSTVLLEPPSEVPRTTSSAPAPRTLPTYYLGSVKGTQARVASASGILEAPASLSEPLTAALLRATSSAWRWRLEDGERIVASAEAAVAEVEAGVQVLPGDDVILSGDTGSVPLTIANSLEQAVTVGVRLVGSPPARLEAESLSGITIAPGKRESLVVPVRVIGGDPLLVRVEVLDADGAVFGAAGEVDLRTTAYARAARWFTIGAAVLLGVMVVFDIWRRVRRRPQRPAT